MTRRNSNAAVVALSSAALLFAWLSTPVRATGSDANADFVARWQGSLSVNGTQLRLIFDICASDDGTLEASLDSPDQGVTGIPVAAVTLEDDSIRLELPAIGAAYSGRLADGKQAVQGEWRQSGRVLPLKLERGDAAADPEAGD
jgi:hypothetical protein